MVNLTSFSQIDIIDNPIRRMDINKWKDSYLKDVSDYFSILYSCFAVIILISLVLTIISKD